MYIYIYIYIIFFSSSLLLYLFLYIFSFLMRSSLGWALGPLGRALGSTPGWAHGTPQNAPHFLFF